MRTEHANKYARKWYADGHDPAEPTDEALRDAFAQCVRPAKPDEYDAIREAIASYITVTMTPLECGHHGEVYGPDGPSAAWCVVCGESRAVAS